ncbi:MULTISPECIES: ABC transporter substrate-binding protein [unclassified Streptomyces]|uniref:ABC transporter substrate-binding protein n=1 Tax=unclassified Streptomyces TaxID=2593676 RepID=UPI00225804A5|nr:MULTISPECIES: ABC transporter substrate-binding protein [unclassified Streptomyces]WSP55210.1 ABC transporter substrate-binding protein [Streptomyces sp. NBC_01241]WSU24064.1 ABC transporter substrate-binding protein [Streptomyces sp. NBC_01108]MCX4786879.1 ABC transporter substrate-binding protein [Streptomyces sp. NBC_01221]WSJ38639.1 ABC transporter substrate-binding protein [Streptomyces sp. NBC_01321]WSP64930.1 ABC transporter substrate-binding protein [Streptomyces sp. NBC_01240]
MRITRTVAGRSRRAAVLVTTGLTASALLLTGCSSDSDSSDNTGSDANGKITLTVADFGQFGYKEAGLFAKYHELHPNITVKEDVTSDEKVYYPKFLQQLNSGSGLADVQGIEVGRIKELADTKASSFVDLSKAINVDDWVSWKEKQATTADGAVIGAGTDIGPMSLCYNTELFNKAGLPTDREEVAKKVAGGWEDYLKLGEEYKKHAPAGTFFMDSASAMYNAVVSSNAKQYYDESGRPIYKDSPSVKQGWNLAAEAASKKLTQGLAQFDDPWKAALRKGTIATVACPAWMAGQISVNAGDANKGKWNITTAPGSTAANWGGSFLGVPKSGKHVDEATELVKWLTAPEQQAAVFKAIGSFPSNKGAYELPDVKNATLPYFNDAPIGQIYADEAKSIPETVLGPKDGIIKDTISTQINNMEQRGTSPDDAWKAATNAIEKVIG